MTPNGSPTPTGPPARSTPRNPADLPAWDEAVVAAHGLRRHEISTGTLAVRLFQAGQRRALANAPYLEYGGLQCADAALSTDDLEALTALLHRTGAPSLLLKSDRQLAPASARMALDTTYVSFALDLRPGADLLWRDALRTKTRNQVRKAERGDFTAHEGHAELLPEFHAVISECWRDLGTPTHGLDFYAAIARAFGSACRFHIVRDGDRPIAAALLLEVGDTLHHPFAGTLRRYRSASVNNLLYWGIIRAACERGLATFDMGRSAPDAGTYRFKRSWGAIPNALFYHYLLRAGTAPPALDTPVVRLATRAWQRCPLWLSRRLGPSLIRYIL